MTSSGSSETLLLPHRGPGATTTRERTGGLSTEILGQSAARLRSLALLYAFTFFMAGFFPNLLFEVDRALMMSRAANWLPGTIAIVMALVVAAFTRSPRVPLGVAMNVGLAFLVASNYAIAVAEFIDPRRLDMNGWVGLSWVAVWTPLYTVAVPTPPRKALAAMLASVSAVPVVIYYMVATEQTTFKPAADQFFFWVVFPYLLVVIMGFVGARVVYALGKEITRARELGSYRLVERLGQGGMGEVWRARHRLLARPAAIKLIRAPVGGGVASDDAMRRFEREAQVTAQLRSPHTVELWDFGVADDGGFYYVMELLDGLDLETLVKRHGPIPAPRAVYLLRQVCHSLAEAEANGLVHRDIKPANIFVCRLGGDYDFVKVLDFGIVKATHGAIETGVMMTRENVLHGTPAFIAPEQALGGAPIDHRADIYATGCVAYWLLTGELVFTADTSMGVIVHHAHTAPTPPSERTELPIPRDLDDLVLACLAKDPAARPQSAKQLSRRLGEIRDAGLWTEEQAREWWLTHEPGGESARAG